MVREVFGTKPTLSIFSAKPRAKRVEIGRKLRTMVLHMCRDEKLLQKDVYKRWCREIKQRNLDKTSEQRVVMYLKCRCSVSKYARRQTKIRTTILLAGLSWRLEKLLSKQPQIARSTLGA